MKRCWIALLLIPALLAQRQPQNLRMDAPPEPGAPCCLDVKISKWAGPHDPGKAMDITSEVLGKRAGDRVSVWVVSMKNYGLTDTIRVSEASILSRLDNLNPYSHVEMEILMDRGTQLDGWALFARVMIDFTTILLFPAVADIVAIGTGLKNAVAGFVASSPYIVGQIQGRAIPVRSNFNRIEWYADIDLKPGDSLIAHIFSRRWDISPAVPMQFKIDTSQTGFVRIAR